jgi:predicted rRNA methylase YqxC with S4 and FtsJ domains
MKKLAGVVLVCLFPGAGAIAQDHASCPMHAAGASRAAHVDHNHGGATGLDNATSQHHFQLRKDGGEIRLEATDARDTRTRDRAREHLRVVQGSFAAGDFGLPTRIHDATPPGVAVLKERKALVRYAFAESARGGVVRLSTGDPEALAAIHAFLRFQIEDHATGDPTGVAE